MADIDINPFRDHESRTEESTGESIPLIPGEGEVPTWEPEHEQETSFGGGLTQEKAHQFLCQQFVQGAVQAL